MRKALAVLLVFGCTAPAWAQSTGVIAGRISDQSGAAMPGVTVTVTNAATRVVRETVTNDAGIYSVPALQPGTYDLRAELSGFAPQERQGVTLLTGATISADFSLSVAGVAEALTVTAEVPLVETTESGTSGELRLEEVQNLPMLNRNFTGLIQLVPGARPGVVVNSTREAFGNGIGIAGGTGRNVSILMDGADNRDQMVGGSNQNFTIEGIQEFRVMTHEFGAQYGGTNGAVVLATTKSGTNQLHGGGFFFGRDDSMTAKDHFTKARNGDKAPYDRQQFGGSFGGPAVGDKLFFFGAVERIQQDARTIISPNVYNEVLRLQTALPSLNLNPVSQIPKALRDTMYTVKVDYQANTNHSFLVRFAQQKLTNDNSQISALHPDLGPGSNNTDDNSLDNVVASHNWILGNNAVNTFAFQRSYYTDAILCDCGPASPAWVTRNVIFPALNLGRPNNLTDQSFFQEKIGIKNDYSLQLGRHGLKVGGNYSWFPIIGFELNAGCSCTGATTFFDDPSVIINNTNGRYPQGFQTPGIVRIMDIGSTVAGGPLGRTFSEGQKEIGAYVQDDWRVSPTVTLNLGLRYDLMLNAFNQNVAGNNRGFRALQAIGHPYGSHPPETPTTEFSPRVGFAWDASGDGRTVVRGSGGLLYDPFLHVLQFRSALLSKETLLVVSRYQNSQIGVGPLANYVYGVSPLPPGPPALNTELPSGRSLSGEFMAPDFRNARNYTGHIGVERQIGSSMAVRADFTHITGKNGARLRELNPIENPWNPNASPAVYGQRRLAAAFGSVLGDPNLFSGVTAIESTNNMRYDELVLSLERRSSRASLLVSYTLAESKAYGGIFTTGYGGGGISMSVNADDPFGPGEWAPTAIDERHRIVVSGVFELPWGIQASPVMQAASARPYNLIAGTDTNRDGQVHNYARDQYVDPAAGRPVPMNSARGQASFNLDTRVTKFFNLQGTTRLGVFAEFYNLTNRANFGNAYVGNGLSPQFRQPNNYMVGLPNARQMQWGARFSF